jgi:hypothetical protein
MRCFKDKDSHAPQRLTPPTTKFIGEQDGDSERDLKACFSELFRQEVRVQSAYLTRAEHGDGTGIHVILAIRRRGGEDLSLISKLGKIFGDMFGSHEHLDMMFVGEDEERELQKVCLPFYRATVGGQ